MTIETKPVEQLAQEDIVRQTLETAARRIEQQQGNSVYMIAWAKAAKIIRALKPD